MILMVLKPTFHLHPLYHEVNVLNVRRLHQVMDSVHRLNDFAVILVHVWTFLLYFLHCRKQKLHVRVQSLHVWLVQFHYFKESCVDLLVLRHLNLKTFIFVFTAQHAQILFAVSEDNLKHFVHMIIKDQFFLRAWKTLLIIHLNKLLL